ncbi:hypothetical protein AVEN_81945-1 [Araneus ventricosus]|uniref:Uncharacterized protein n=1 Tax=Araneus ventricosus TaxID=182803 RepID=A0A4Y2X912_ARAVE|nr:hypothetical protein AVEN_81945-1 [Araneus ventricosus]
MSLKLFTFSVSWKFPGKICLNCIVDWDYSSKTLLRPRWPGLDLGTGGSQVRNPIPPKIRRVWGLLHDESYVVAKRPPVGVRRKFGEGCQLRCRPRHLTAVQNYEVRL